MLWKILNVLHMTKRLHCFLPFCSNCMTILSYYFHICSCLEQWEKTLILFVYWVFVFLSLVKDNWRCSTWKAGWEVLFLNHILVHICLWQIKMLTWAFWWFDCLLTSSGPHSLNDTVLSLHSSGYVRLLQVKSSKISPLCISLPVLLLFLYCPYLSVQNSVQDYHPNSVIVIVNL